MAKGDPSAGGDPRVEVTRHAGLDADDALAESGLDDLLAGLPHPDATRRLAWQRAWRQTVGAEADLVTLVARRGGEVVGVLALERATRGMLRLVRPRGHADPWFSMDVPARDGAALRALLAAAAREDADLLQIDGLEGDEATRAAVEASLPRARVSSMTTWRLDPDDPPRPMRKRRKEVRRAVRRAADAGVELRTVAERDPAALRRRLGALLDFHGANFAGEGEDRLVHPPQRRLFTEAAVIATADDGNVRLVEVHTGDGGLVAFDLALVTGDSAIAYAGAIDRAREDLPSLGWVSMLALVELLQEEGVRRIDFGSGEAAYKTLIARPAPLWRVVAPLSLCGRAALAGRRGAALASRGIAAGRTRLRRGDAPEGAPEG